MVHEAVRLVLQGSSVTYTVLKDAVQYFKTRASSIRRTEGNLQKLTYAIGVLSSRKERIDQIMGLSVTKEKTGEYKIFVENYEVLLEKYKKFIIRYQELQGDLGCPGESPIQEFLNYVMTSLKNRTSSIWTWNFWKLAKFNKHVVELCEYISQVTSGLNENNMMVEAKPTVVHVERYIYELPQLNVYVEEVLRYLGCAENKRISIVGSIGVGKTTVMEMVRNRLVAPQSSDINDKLIIWIRCEKLGTDDKMYEAMQDEIMVRLQIFKDKTKSMDQNADYISMRLQKEKYVLFMDQVSSRIDIDRLGILKGHPHGKVVIATSNKPAINPMKIDVEVEIHKLSKEDSFKLFETICGRIHDMRMQHIAEVIVQCCGGLPRVIKIVAEYLKRQKDENFWHGVKTKLQSDPKPGLLGLQGVGKVYEMMYEELEDYMKKCSLYGALFPSEYKIYKSYLVECWRAEGFFEHKEYIRRYRNARDEGMIVLHELETRYLLESCSDKHVQMPVYYRKVALAQDFPGEEKSKMWVGDLKNQFPGKESWSTTNRMSLIRQLIPETSAVGTSRSATIMLNSPETGDGSIVSELKISTLLLQSNEGLNELDADFFSRMKNLRVLDLHRTGIESLPSSIGDLEKLINLYLNECKNLAMLPREVEKLEKLELLDIRRTSINPWLPQQIGRMTGLRCLRVTFDQNGCSSSSKGKEVEVATPWDVISSLNVLEELVIETDICSEDWINIADKIVDVLVNLVQLTTLHFNFHSLESLQKFIRCSMSWRNKSTHWGNSTFRSFRFFVGCQKVLHPYGSDICGVSAERHLRLSSIDKVNCSIDLEVLKQASAFELVGNSHAKSLNEFYFANMGTLKVCVIEGCDNVECIIDVDDMNKLPTERFSDFGILQNLEKLILYNLKSLQCIWKGNFLTESFLSLTVLIMSDCPELTKITTEIWISLKKLVIIRCGKLMELSMTRENAKSLTFIECEASWWAPLQLEDEDKEHFTRFCHFIHEENNTALHITYEGEASSSTICQEITIDEHAEDRADDNKVLEVNSFAKNDEQLSEEILDSQGKCFPWPKSKKLRVKSKSKGKDQAEPSKAADSRVADSEELVSNKGGIKISEIKDDKSIDTSKEEVVFHVNGVTTNMGAKADTSGEMPDNVEHSESMNHPTNDEKGNSLGDRLNSEGAGSGTEGRPEGMPGNVEISEIMTPTNNWNGKFFGDPLSKERVGNGTEGALKRLYVM